MPASRPYWRGVLRLSLVTCPVALYPASSEGDRTHFHQINRKTGNRLRQQLVDEATGEVVGKEDKGRGYEVAKGSYVPIEAEDLKSIALDSTRTIDIEKFVPAKEIDKRYYDRPYYLVPDGKSGEDAFAVLRDAMKGKGRVAIGRVVLANREHIVAIEDWDKGMLCTTLRYDYEVRPVSEYFGELKSPRVSKDMIDLASHILDSKAGKFDPSAFKDEYEQALRNLVTKKAAGGTIGPSEPKPEHTNVVDLMTALRRSLEATAPRGASPRSGTSRQTSSGGAATSRRPRGKTPTKGTRRKAG